MPKDDDDINLSIDGDSDEMNSESGEEGSQVDSDMDDDDDGLSLAEASDYEDLISLDDDAPSGLIEYDGSDGDDGADEEWGGVSESGTKRKRDEQAEGTKPKKRRAGPTFASYEDYAKMIEEGPEDDL